MANEYKVVLIGNSESGKTSFIKSVITGEKNTKYSPTLGVEVHPIKINDLYLNVWDLAGNPKYGGLVDCYLMQSRLGIVFMNGEPFNELTRLSIDNLNKSNTPLIYVKLIEDDKIERAEIIDGLEVNHVYYFETSSLFDKIKEILE
jgi:GTPase SAR1 family protein